MNIFLLAEAAQNGCTLNGQPIDCGELADKAKPFIGLGIGIFVIVFILATVALVFWLIMLLHALNHKSPNRDTWIIVLIVSFVMGFGLVAAIIYYFAEKQNAELATPSIPEQKITPSSEDSKNKKLKS